MQALFPIEVHVQVIELRRHRAPRYGTVLCPRHRTQLLGHSESVRDDGETPVAPHARATRRSRHHAARRPGARRGVHNIGRAKNALFLLDPPRPSLDIDKCTLTHYTPRYRMHEIPEVDAYRWIARAEVPELSGRTWRACDGARLVKRDKHKGYLKASLVRLLDDRVAWIAARCNFCCSANIAGEILELALSRPAHLRKQFSSSSSW